jgi:hypothetical protein
MREGNSVRTEFVWKRRSNDSLYTIPIGAAA